MMGIVIEGLNMKAVNSLMWTSAVLAKVGILFAVVYGLIILVMFLAEVVD